MRTSEGARAPLTPHAFIEKWERTNRTERQAAQEHFIDLCRVLGEPTPNEADDPDAYSFEKGIRKIDGTGGFADVWKRGCFGWEYKKDRASLDRAYQQLQLYSVALENPPLLIVSDTKHFRVYTNWTNTVQERHEFALKDIARAQTLDLLQNVFRHPDRLQPQRTREQVTRDAAKEFSAIAERLRMQGHPPEKVAHFLNRIVFCMFAEDVNLLQDDLFKRLLDTLAKRRDKVQKDSQHMLSALFAHMRGGGQYGVEHILHFNGGLFDDDHALPLDADSLDILRRVARQDWSAIDPTIFGTLFERLLDPDKRAQIGAHYTDADKIMKIVEPVILRPLTAEWETCKGDIAGILSRSRGKPGKAVLDRAEARLDRFLKRLDSVRVLDPACGSGNFLYLAMQALKDLERRAIVEAHEMGLGLRVIHCGPHNVKGIEINTYAAELARTAIWIGNIQWERRNGYQARKEPVLQDLQAIECRDALVTRVNQPSPHTQPSLAGLTRGSTSPARRKKQGVDGRDKPGHDGASEYVEAEWPEAEFIIGNPPFLGGKLMRSSFGDKYTETLFHLYEKRVRSEADLVVYWLEKALGAIPNRARSAGFVATQSIRRGASRAVLDRIANKASIFNAWADEPWIIDGAAVRVCLICFRDNEGGVSELDGIRVSKINSDLSSGATDLTRAIRLLESKGVAFQGTIKVGAFDIPSSLARDWLRLPANANGYSNSDVVKPWANASDLAGRPSDTWIVDFGTDLSERESALYEAPFHYILQNVKPVRSMVRRQNHRENWWRHGEARPGMRRAIEDLPRFLVTPRVSKHRFFVWLPINVLPDSRLVVIGRADDTTFGILHSKFHEEWTLRLGGWHGVGNDPQYTPTQGFETFPFPEGLTPNIPAKDYANDPRATAIAKAAKHLDDLRNAWLNPPDLIDIVPEVVSGYPDRILPKNEEAAAILKKRTLTNLYNARPQWLADAHRDLDAAVAAAYGWPTDISEEDALAKLLELNLARAGSRSAPPVAEQNEEDD